MQKVIDTPIFMGSFIQSFKGQHLLPVKLGNGMKNTNFEEVIWTGGNGRPQITNEMKKGIISMFSENPTLYLRNGPA